MRLIDADALAMAIVDAGQASKRYKIGDFWELRYTEIKEVMDEQPTVDAVPVRHGMWLPKHHYIAGHEFVSGHICSECGDDALNAEGDEFLTDYCPNCGARMDKE